MFLVVVSVLFRMCDSEVHVTALLETLIDFQLILILYTSVTITEFRSHYPSAQPPVNHYKGIRPKQSKYDNRTMQFYFLTC